MLLIDLIKTILFYSILYMNDKLMQINHAIGVSQLYQTTQKEQKNVWSSMPIYPLQRVFYPQNRPCTPKIVGTFYMQGYKVKEKAAIVSPVSKLSGHPVVPFEISMLTSS